MSRFIEPPAAKHSAKASLRIALVVLGVGCMIAGSWPVFASDFTAFAEDEDVCRGVGAAAVKDGGGGPSAAQRYDRAYGRCMMIHGRRRQMDAYANGPRGPVGNPHGFEFPDAYYSVPYATPGYGYDGFSY